MTFDTISERLKRIASYVEKGSRVADIGSDHALLPTYLIKNDVATYCVAGEVNKGPFDAARSQVNKTELDDKIDVRLGDGLAVLKPNEVNTICIAGMGGALITRILSEGIERVDEVQQLILQPNIGSEHVRRFFLEHNWELVKEEILEEDEKIYEILAAKRGDVERAYQGLSINREWAVRIGPLLWKNPSETLFKKWENEKDKLDKIINSLSNTTDPEALEKRKMFQQEREELEGLLKCMQAEIKSLNT